MREREQNTENQVVIPDVPGPWDHWKGVSRETYMEDHERRVEIIRAETERIERESTAQTKPQETSGVELHLPELTW